MSISTTTFLFLAEAAPAAQGQQQPPGFGSFLIPFACMIAIFYFLIIRPQQKKTKEQQALINSVKTGDKIVTTSGIHGLVSNVKEKTLVVKVADNVKIEFDKSAVSIVAKAATEAANS